MDEKTKQELLAKNQKLIDMVIERVKRDYPEDIAIVGLTGSFSTGDYHEKSDLDLIIINNTPKGWEISRAFILGDVGYDIYCTPWETRIEAQSALDSPMAGCLVDLQILYCGKPEYLERLNGYRRKALDELAKPIGRDSILRGRKNLDKARQELANALLADEIGPVRLAAGGVLHHAINGVISLNNTYIKRGIKRYAEELSACAYLPEGFQALSMAVVEGKTVPALRDAAAALLRATIALADRMWEELVEQPEPTGTNLRGTYEELWCNCRNKVLDSTARGDKSYAFHAALGAQAYLDEMREMFGTPKFDLLKSFDPDNLPRFREVFLQAMEDYLAEYRKVGLPVDRFDTFEELYREFMMQK